MPPSDAGRSRRRLIDGGLLAATAAGVVLVIAANRERPQPPWPPGSVTVSRAAVAQDPLDPAALRNLGLALDSSGDVADADRLMTLAWSRTRRDTPTTAWLLVRRLSQGRYAEAIAAADALLRRNRDEAARERLFKFLIAAAHYDVSRPALIGRLADGPWWRLAYIRELAARADPQDARLVFAGLAETANPPSPPELAALVTRLVDDKAYVAAARDWRAFSRPRRDPQAVDDVTAPPPFGWSPVSGEGASSTVEGGALRIDYDGYASPQLPGRLLTLAPGRYTLTWRERYAGDDAGAISVAVRCADATTPLAVAPPPANTSLHNRRLDFSVPETHCEGQWLSIIPKPRDRRATVTAWFHHWALTRTEP